MNVRPEGREMIFLAVLLDFFSLASAPQHAKKTYSSLCSSGIGLFDEILDI
jgi:hypothetical protein